jgi:Uncharacterised nucleotidyltransferase
MSAGVGPRSGFLLLLDVLRDPRRAALLTPGEWDDVLSAAERSKLAGRLDDVVSRVEAEAGAPDWARDRLVSARIHGQEFGRVVRWEIDRILRALGPAGIEPVFLKGAGYIAAGLPFAAGRVVADVDFLVPESALTRTESALEQHGWAFVEQSA